MLFCGSRATRRRISVRLAPRSKSRMHTIGAERATFSVINPHRVYGIFFSMYDRRMWWYEGVVAFRKIAIAAIGVFGGNFVAMQVHITSLLMMFTICVTALVEPYGPKAKVLHYLDMGLLVALWMTLWAASVFNQNPRCEDGVGGTLVWCDFLSVMIGLIDACGIAVFVSLIVYYKTLTCRAKVKIILNRFGRRNERTMTPPTPTKSGDGGQESAGGGGLLPPCSSEDQTMIEMAPFKEVNENEEKTLVDNPIITKQQQQQRRRRRRRRQQSRSSQLILCVLVLVQSRHATPGWPGLCVHSALTRVRYRVRCCTLYRMLC